MQLSNAFVGQIGLFAGTITPGLWLPCNGQSVLISGYPDLFKIIGTNYGGDGIHNFKLPTLSPVNKARYFINSANGVGRDPKGTLGEIILFHKNNVPAGWAECNGSILKKSENEDLYMLIGGDYGHSSSEFALPVIPPPDPHMVYAVSTNGTLPWGGGQINNFDIIGTIGTIELFPTLKGFQSEDWLLCNGQAVSVSDYGELYMVIGNIWGKTGGNFDMPSIPGPALNIDYIICSNGLYPSEI